MGNYMQKNDPNKFTTDLEQIKLTVPQQRAIRASLMLFEKALRNADRLLSETEFTGILYYRRSRIDSKHSRIVRKKISKALDEVAKFVKKLHLTPVEENIEGSIMAEMSISWENLEECRSKRMQGYGDLDPNTAALIDPIIGSLARRAIALSNLVVSEPKNVIND